MPKAKEVQHLPRGAVSGALECVECGVVGVGQGVEVFLGGAEAAVAVLVIDFGDREERWPMDQVRVAAVGAPSWLREWVNQTTREEEAAHAWRHGGWFGD